jgi:hypothetical protein
VIYFIFNKAFNMNLNNILGIYTRVAQWIRHRSSKAGTAGSSPAVGIFITYNML